MRRDWGAESRRFWMLQSHVFQVKTVKKIQATFELFDSDSATVCECFSTFLNLQSFIPESVAL